MQHHVSQVGTHAAGCNDGVPAVESPPPRPDVTAAGPHGVAAASRRREITIGDALHPADVMPEVRQEIPRRGSYKSCLQKQQEEDRRKNPAFLLNGGDDDFLGMFFVNTP